MWYYSSKLADATYRNKIPTVLSLEISLGMFLNSILVYFISPRLSTSHFLPLTGFCSCSDAIMAQDYCVNYFLGACDRAVPQYYFSAIIAKEDMSCLCEFFLCFHSLAFPLLWLHFSSRHRAPSTHFVNQIKRFWILLDARWKVLDKHKSLSLVVTSFNYS